MNRNQYDQDERMHRGLGRQRELERQRNQQFQGQYSRAQRFQNQETGYAGSGAYAQMDDDFEQHYDSHVTPGRYVGGGGYGGMERQWQSPSQELHGGYGPYAQASHGSSLHGQLPYGQLPYGQAQQGWSEPPMQYGGYPGAQGQYGQPYGQQGLYGQQASFGQQGQYGQQDYGSKHEDLYGQQGQYGSQLGKYGVQGQRGLSGQENFRGRGPKGYTRSDERIKEEICERLTRHPEIDASEIELESKQGVITLSGSVDQRRLKHLVEDLVENVSGVKDIENRITVKPSTQSAQSGSQSGYGRQPVGVTTGSLGGSSESKPRH
jgi:hypothetical protein